MQTKTIPPWLVVALCFGIVAIDGFDTAAIGFLAPAIRAEWALSPQQLAPVFGAGLAGLMAGAFLFGPLADRFGRKRVLLFCVLFFGAASLLSAGASSLWPLVGWRFLTGLGLGGAMPNAVTLTSESCPPERRSLLVTTMFCGFTVGSALGGIASAHLVEALGWRSVLVIGGVLPIALLPLLAWKLPEPVRRTATQRGSPVGHLFQGGLLRGTLMLWLAFFMSLLVIYLLSSWLPTLIRTTGLSLKTASLVTAMFQVGGTVGAIALGALMDRVDPHRVLAASYGLAGVFIALIGASGGSIAALSAAVFCAGFCVSGAQVGANALSAGFYPADCRATGVAWANGVGRIGSVLGSVGGGAMLAMGLSMPQLFSVVALPAFVAGLTMALLGWHRGGRASLELGTAH
ncbi:aromatic acid/H+ symport family MFS transporter [Pelomonas sp. KK5]|uniref:MFS transporter n=1 Tax=Pelomonas sp. KK5 TaxID=1855730 RepID=UPI00097C35AD|nr:aromatic acid/H+ symport family MFS transporter [Pelomonas sp. KK5]